MQVTGRCAVEGVQTQDSRSICQLHHDRWLQHFKPTQCAACPRPLSSSASRPCPEWMRKQLHAHHGAFVHKRPCYEKALAAKKQLTVAPQSMEVEQENIPPQLTFHIDVSTTLTTAYRDFDAYAHTHNYPLYLVVIL